MLGYLLCCCGRHALRGQIALDLWGSESVSGEEYLQKATTRLRRLLGGEPSFQLTDNKKRYALADQSQIWTDRDHCITLMAEVEEVGRTTLAAIARLEEAERLFRRGTFLEEEASSWFHAPRGELITLFYRCRQYLLEAYQTQGMYPQEERTAEAWLREDPFNETALRHLMQSLHEQGMTHEAQRRYRETAALAKKMGHELSPDMEAFARQLPRQPRTQAFLSGQEASFSPPHSPLQGTILGTGVLVQGESDTDPLRRKFGGLVKQTAQASLVGTFAPDMFRGTDLLERLVQAVKRPSSIDRTLLEVLRSSVTHCWELGPEVVGMVSSEHLTQVHTHLAYLIELLESSLYSSVRQQLSSLAAECSLIVGTLYFDMDLPAAAERYFTTAYTVAEEAGDLALKAVIRGWMSMLPGHSLAFLEEALPLAKRYGTDTTYSWLQARKAEVYAEHLSENEEYATECEKALEQATTFSAKGDPEHDPYWSGFDQLLMYGYQGACYIKLEKPEAAKTALLQALQLSNPHNTYHQTVLQIDLARVYQLQNDIINACLCGHRALSMISHAHSPVLLRRLSAFRTNFAPGQTETAIQAFDEHKMSVEELIREQAQFEEMR